MNHPTGDPAPLPAYDLMPEEELVRLHDAAVRRNLYGTKAEVAEGLRRMDAIERALLARRKARVEDVAFANLWQVRYVNRFAAIYALGARRVYATFSSLGTVSYLDAIGHGQRGPDLTDQLLEALKK